jgi:hypothetical protein
VPLASEAAALFQVITQRNLNSSTVLTTNLGITSWGQIFDDPTVAVAMLDRLLHRSVVFNIDGESYRMRKGTPRPSRNPPPSSQGDPHHLTSTHTHPADHLGISMIDTGEIRDRRHHRQTQVGAASSSRRSGAGRSEGSRGQRCV